MKNLYILICMIFFYSLLSFFLLKTTHLYFDDKLKNYDALSDGISIKVRGDEMIKKLNQYKQIENRSVRLNRHILTMLNALTYKTPRAVRFSRVLYSHDQWDIQGVDYRNNLIMSWSRELGRKIISLSFNDDNHIFKLKII